MKPTMRIRLAAVAASICAVAATWVAPTASADVATLDIVAIGPSAGYGTHCAYLLVARTKDSASTSRNRGVSFVDLNRASRILPADELADRNIDRYYTTPVIADHAVALWIPTGRGKHTLMAYQTSAGGPQRTVTVTSGTPVGPGCIVGR